MLPNKGAFSVSKTKPSREYLIALKKRYAQASKKERTAILDEFVKTSGYHRKHATALLLGKRVHRLHPAQRPRAKVYTEEDRRALFKLLDLFDYISSKRLRVAMNDSLPRLRRQGFLRVSPAGYQHLRVISPSTIDRIRAMQREPGQRRKGFTKPGSLLKHQIPIRTFAEWDEATPGFVEMDLVDHSGGSNSGDFAYTLNVTDVRTGWTEMRAVPNKAQVHVFAALTLVRQRLPVPLKGVDSDNGSEFIHDQLLRYCEQEHITFTRGRVGRKNDNPFVEQKTWSVVRRLVGYRRYEAKRHVDLLNRLYHAYSLYHNFFLPVVKLQEKKRIGSRVQRVFDEPATPYTRLLTSPDVSEADKRKLRATYAKLDVVQLKSEIDELSAKLLSLRIR